MLGALLGTAARAAVTGAAGLAVIGVLKEAKVGDTLRDVAVTLTEVGVRGYKLVETGVEKVADVATDVFTEAKNRTEEPTPAAPTTTFADEMADVADPAAPVDAIIVDLTAPKGDSPSA